MKICSYLTRHSLTLIISVITGILSTILWVYYALMIGNIIDSIGKIHPEDYLYIVPGVMIFILFVRILNAISLSIRSIYVNQTINDLRNDYLSALYQQTSGLDKGKILSRISHDLYMVKERYLTHLTTVLMNIISFVLSSYFLLRINVTVTLVLYVVAMLVLSLPSCFKKKIHQYQVNMSQSSQLLTDKIQDDLYGFETISDYHINEPMKKEAQLLGKKLSQRTIRAEVLQALIGQTAHLFVTLLGSIGFILGTYFVMTGDISYGEMVAIVQLSNTLVSPIDEITHCLPQMMAGKKQLKTLLYDIQQAEIDQPLSPPIAIKDVESIEFQNVTLILDNQSILDHINCHFKRGKKYLIIGKTGSGKSTLLKMISHVYSEYQGNIYINQIPLNQLHQTQLSSLITKMNQFPYLFKKTIRENISLYRPIDDNAILQALCDVQMENLCDHLDDLIMPDTYSGGEKQRIALCRMLVQRNQICLLDEVTSALDIKTAQHIEDQIQSLHTNILICISHHLSPTLLKQFDEVILMDQGKIIEQAPVNALQHREYLPKEMR